MAGATRAAHKRKQHLDSKNNETVLIDSAKSAEKMDDEKITSTQNTASPERKVRRPGGSSGSPGVTPERILAIKAVSEETNQPDGKREAGAPQPASLTTDEVAGMPYRSPQTVLTRRPSPNNAET